VIVGAAIVGAAIVGAGHMIYLGFSPRLIYTQSSLMSFADCQRVVGVVSNSEVILPTTEDDINIVNGKHLQPPQRPFNNHGQATTITATLQQSQPNYNNHRHPSTITAKLQQSQSTYNNKQPSYNNRSQPTIITAKLQQSQPSYNNHSQA